MRRPFLRAILALASLSSLSACRATVGHACSDADMHSAQTLVYDAQGNPAYAGQAIMLASCAGGGSFCHSASATRRYGAPADLNFDPLLADDAHNTDPATGMAHLYASQLLIHRDRDDIYATVLDGSMPPGNAGRDTDTGPFMQFAPGASEGTPLPGLGTVEGVELLRVWLACGSPVIQATTDTPPASCTRDSDCSPLPLCDLATSRCVPVGTVAAPHAVTVAPTWTSIYSSIVRPTCAIEACHGASGAELSGQLDLSTPSIAYAALVDVGATSSSCGTRIVPGDPGSSFFVAKIEATQDPTSCGTEMPPGTSLPADQLAAIRAWISAGAMQD